MGRGVGGLHVTYGEWISLFRANGLEVETSSSWSLGTCEENIRFLAPAIGARRFPAKHLEAPKTRPHPPRMAR